MKKCSGCGETKPLEAFDRYRRDEEARVSRCKACGLARRRELAQTRNVDRKFCGRCEVVKPSSEFQKNRASRDGLQAYCKPCAGDYQREYAALNAEKIAARNLRKLTTPITATRTKRCKVCGEEKPLLEFWANRGTADRRAIYCKPCQREYDRARRAKTHEQNLESQRKWREANPDKRREMMRAWNLRVYGLTPDDYLRMYDEQGGRCFICRAGGEDFGGRRLHVDHDHETGKVRGLLCGLCNSALGKFKDSPELLRRAASYLEVTT